MYRFGAQGWTVAASRRDPRVDVLRGLALVMIFIDHIPGDFLNLVTLRNFGFCDAAEIFVLLAGFASMSAYGKCFEREGARSGLRRVALRCIRIYLFQLGLLVTTLAIRRVWVMHFGFGAEDIASIFDDGLASVGRILTLRELPAGLDILPLYIILLTVFPLTYAVIRLFGPGVALAGSALLWLAANLDPRLNLINALDGKPWYLNPFAWQFLFTIGAVLALTLHASGGNLPRRTWLVWLCWAYLGVAFLEAAPWTAWGLPDLAPLPIATPDKTSLSPVRLLDALALIYLVLSSRRLGAFVRRPAFVALEACGKHSLEVFSLGTLVSLIGQLAMQTFGIGLEMQLAVNGLGFAGMFGVGLALERGRVRTPARPATRALGAVRNLKR